ncbi:exodeoxyribonuclease V subunit gamma [Marinospirillum insulare]|uniref:RecBCD enzyme subunit RecC n=1 Tax=Marinospirillum insulare TaxID=217169 RepID=A0ABQ5ZUB1_9GAMM|nr:exodeoxyribonuclease V subunit gamma [Marinospirillum insulare]GLR63589.1 RecBCD enzyme subunit RecC [Marinospirillum insulare]
MSSTLSPLEPGFMLLQGNRLEDLRDLLSEWITSYPLKPLEDECILVQSNGIAQWLKMALARDQGGCGIAAAMKVDLPGRFLWQAYRSVFDELPEISPYDKAPLTWRLYRLLGDWPALEACVQKLGENLEELEPLKGFLNQDTDPRRLHQLAANLADLYDQYQVYRADWLEAWEKNNNSLITAKGQVKPLETADLWQAVVWRLLVEDVQQDTDLPDATSPWARASRATIHQAVIKKCESYTPENRPEDLPRRVLVFGISSLPRQTLDLLHALAPFTQIMVFASNPCQHYWGDLVEGKELLKREYKRISERKISADLNPEDLHLEGHPLLASWGKQGRDYLHLLDEQDEPDSYREKLASIKRSIDLYRDPLDEGNSLLNQLQSDIYNLRPLKERQELNTPIDPEKDTSLQFLVAHSAQREVEILHDQLLATFEKAQQEGKELPPREVLVMVPDINVYAPHIQAVFGRYAGKYEERDPRFLPFHITDQSQRGQNTLLIALEKLLQLPSSRFAVSELLDLLDTPALRENYQLEEADLPRLKEWIQGANIRWGLNAQQRGDLGLPEEEQNTWLFGLRRLLLGFASGASESWQGIEPHDEVAGLEAALLGPLAQLLNDLETTLNELQKKHTPAAWLTTFTNLTQRFFVETSQADGWALVNLENQLENLEKVWQHASLNQQELPLEVVAEELLSALDQPTLTQKFLGGSINFATLMPMRAIPFKQVWLLGMNDGDYPRSVRPADFDLMAKDYRPGDRSRREDDRYLFLEALLSAREKLVISWIGRSIRDNTPRPASVLVGQLRDHLAAGWNLNLEDLTTEHSLQAFSRQYFMPNRLPQIFTYAHEWRRLHESPEKVEQDLPPWQAEAPVTLKELAAFLRHPVKTFYTQRLGVNWYNQNETLEDEEAFTLNGLEVWSLQNKMIEQITQALALQPEQPISLLLKETAAKIERSGDLAVPPFAQSQSYDLQEDLLLPLEAYKQLLQDYPQALAPQLVRLELTDEQGKLLLEDSLSDLRCNAAGERLRLVVQASRIHKGKSYKWYHLVRQWPAHLFAQLTGATQTRVLGPDTDLVMPTLEAEEAEKLLLEILAAWRSGMSQLLPLPCKTAFDFLDKEGKPWDTYEGNQRLAGEVSDHPAFVRFWPSYASLQKEPLFTELSQGVYQPLMDILTSSKQEAETNE